jgi:serine/threonine protein kinase
MVAYVDPKIFEQKMNHHQQYSLSNKSDIYSIGILLWELSSGRPPYCNKPSDTSDIDLASEILRGLREKPVVNTPVDYVIIYTGRYT